MIKSKNRKKKKNNGMINENYTKEMRAEDKKKEKTICIWNKVVLVVFLIIWGFSMKLQDNYIIVINALLPIIAICLAIRCKDFYIIKKGKNKQVVPLFIITVLSSIPLLAMMLSDYNIDLHFLYWMYVIILVFILLFTIFKYTTYKIGDLDHKGGIVLCVFFYCIGVIANINCGLFNTNETVYPKVEVVDKYIKKGRIIERNYIILEHFEKYKDAKTTIVSYDNYEKIDINDRVNVITYKGILGIDWYKIDSDK